MPPLINLIGQKFGRLIVLEQIKGSKYTSWECRCSCGNTLPITTNSLRTKGTQSCGCLRKETTSKRKTTHGMTGSPEYRTWQHMKERCYKPSTKGFKNYGGRGITVCDEWRDSFLAFYKHIGPKPHKEYTIDRIRNNGNYEPGNVQWADRKTQANNSRRNCCITIDGITKTVIQWAKVMNINPNTIISRLHYGWNPQEAVIRSTDHTITLHGWSLILKQWARFVGINRTTIFARLEYGWPIAKAIFQPVNHKIP